MSQLRNVWQREWVSFCKHYGHGNDAVLTYLPRYVFRTAIGDARIRGMDQTHVIFRWRDRSTDAWRTERRPGVELLRGFVQDVLPRDFHKVRYNGLWHHSKRDQCNRAWLLLFLATPADTAQPLKKSSVSEPLSQLTELTDQALDEMADHDVALLRCPHCGSFLTVGSIVVPWRVASKMLPFCGASQAVQLRKYEQHKIDKRLRDSDRKERGQPVCLTPSRASSRS
jgi:hypothetical protein